jgi:dipeptidyl aminopeptidase/acylaminoacyl peptidase
MLDVTTGEVERLAGHLPFVEVSLSPDGILAYERMITDIYVRFELLDTRNGRFLGAFHGSSPTWSPDGDTLAFVVGSLAFVGASRLMMMDPDGSNVRTLVEPVRKGSSLAWSPDGRLIAFMDRDGTVMAQPIAGGPAWPLTPSGFEVDDVSWARSPGR